MTAALLEWAAVHPIAAIFIATALLLCAALAGVVLVLLGTARYLDWRRMRKVRRPNRIEPERPWPRGCA